MWKADHPGRDWARGEEKAQEWGGGTAKRTQKRQAEPMRRRKGGEDQGRGCGHLSFVKVSMACWRTELERESSGSS